MGRKRAKGGGRKSRAGPTSPLTFRIPDDLRRELELEATKDGSVSERLLWHLRRSINRKHEEERNPSLQALLGVIARLAEEITGGELMPDRAARSELQGEWRTDLFKFQAFKFAVKKLLDTLKEPTELPRMSEEERERIAREAAQEFGDSPEFIQLFLNINRSPRPKEHGHSATFGRALPNRTCLSPKESKELCARTQSLGRVIEREYYSFQKAKKALELEPEPDRLQKTLGRLGGAGKLSPDIEASLRAISEASGLPPTLEGVKKLIKSIKPKDKTDD